MVVKKSNHKERNGCTKDTKNHGVEDRAKILSSEKDREVFFDALINPPKPSEELLKAADVYEKYMSK